MSMDILKDQIKNNKIGSLYLFYGPEEYLKKYYLESIEKKLLQEDLKPLNRIVIDSGKPDIKKIVENCEALPVFSDRKVVIVKNSGLFKSKKKTEGEEEKSSPSNDAILAYLQNIPEFTCLVFYEAEIDKRMKLADTIKKKGLIVEFAYQKPDELARWATKVFRSYGKEIDPMTTAKLLEYCEPGMTDILNEINKLNLFLKERSRVTSEDIDRVCTKSIRSRIFDLTDAVAERNGVKALKMLNDMIVLKEPLPKVLFMIARQFRQVLEMKLLKQEGASIEEAASRLSVSPYAAKKILKQAGSFSTNVLEQALEECLALDTAIKTGRINDRMAAELLVVKYSKG